MDDSQKIIIFSLDSQSYGLQLNSVCQVLRAVEITQVPSSANLLMGVVNIHGSIMPVLNIRKLMGLRQKNVTPSDQFILVEMHSRKFIIPADTITGISAYHMNETGTAESGLHRQAQYIRDIIRKEDRLIFLIDLEKTLSLSEAHDLESMVLNGSRMS